MLRLPALTPFRGAMLLPPTQSSAMCEGEQ